MQNQVWMIEFSYEYDSMLHNAWLDIPYVFLLFIEIISDKHTFGQLHDLFSINPSLIYIDAWLVSWCPLEMRTQVPP